MAGLNFSQLWHYLGAIIGGHWAPRVEHTARGRVQGTWHLAGQQNPLSLGIDYWVGNGHSGEQRPSVGMYRVAIYFVTVGDLHQPTQVHHGNSVADVAHN